MSKDESHVDVQKQLLASMLAADRKGANAVVDAWAEENSYDRAVSELLEPVLQEFGQIWATDEDVSLAQGYISAKIAEDIMLRAAGCAHRQYRRPQAAPRRT